MLIHEILRAERRDPTFIDPYLSCYRIIGLLGVVLLEKHQFQYRQEE